MYSIENKEEINFDKENRDIIVYIYFDFVFFVNLFFYFRNKSGYSDWNEAYCYTKCYYNYYCHYVIFVFFHMLYNFSTIYIKEIKIIRGYF